MEEYTDTERSFTRNIVLQQIKENHADSLNFRQREILLETYYSNDKWKDIENKYAKQIMEYAIEKKLWFIVYQILEGLGSDKLFKIFKKIIYKKYSDDGITPFFRDNTIIKDKTIWNNLYKYDDIFVYKLLKKNIYGKKIEGNI